MRDSEVQFLLGKLDFGKYYYILLYGSTMKIGQTFTEWQLAEFLLDNDPHYRNLHIGDKKNRSNQIEDVLKTAKRHVEKLVEVHLMEQKGTQKQTKGTGMVPIYLLTPNGHNVLRTMQVLELEDGIAEKALFSFTQDIIKIFDNSLSFIKFVSIFIRKAYEKGLFKEYISILRQVAESKDTKDISKYALLISDIVSLQFRLPFLGPKYVELWLETLNEMPPTERKLYLYDLKLIFDTKMGKKAFTRKYEDLRLELIGEIENIALEGGCNNCRKTIIFPIKIVDYMRQLDHLDDMSLSLACPRCNSPGNTLTVPNLWD